MLNVAVDLKVIDGFILDDNKWDGLVLDPFIFAQSTGIAKGVIQDRLKSCDYLGQVGPRSP